MTKSVLKNNVNILFTVFFVLSPEIFVLLTPLERQVSFTTTAAIKDIELVPQHVYRIQFDLRSRIRDKIFKDAPWTLIARHFFSIMQLHDEKAIIV